MATAVQESSPGRQATLRALLLLLVLLGADRDLGAQTTAAIIGTISDASGGKLVAVTVTATNLATNASRTVYTSDAGDYAILNLPLGTYSVRAELQGFKTIVRDGVELTLNRTARVDVALELGDLRETLTVRAEAPLVETATNQMGTLVDQRRIEALPLNGRNALSLVSLVPGSQNLESRAEQGFNINKVAFNGARPELSNWLLDGGDNTSSLRNYGNPVPNPDAIQEFQVISNNYSAEYGRSVGAIVNVVTRSGTNEFHGSLFEFHRNDALNADHFFQGRPTKLEQNQFGGAIGGRVIRDRTFFFASYQAFRRNTEAFQNSALVPTALERRGDFSQSLFQGRPVTIIDPLTGQPFPGNVIPAGRLSPIATRFLEEVVPTPNDPERGPNAYSVTLPISDPSDQGTFKIDHVFSQKHRLSVSYFINDSTETDVLTPIEYFFRDNENRQQNTSIHEYWVIKPTLLNHIRLSFNRSAGSRTLRSEPAFTANDLGMAFGNPPAGPAVAPSFRLTGYFTAAAAAGGPKTSNIYSLANSLSWTTGRHSFKFGAEAWYRRLFDHTQDDRNGGDFRFNGTTAGNAVADFLLGQVSDRFRYRETSYKSNNQWSFYGYVQDDFRASDRLTLNLGVRYELDLYPVHPLDMISVYVPGRQSVCVPQAPEGIVFPCDEGISRAGYKNDTNNVAPRLGFAYDVSGDSKTIVRGGYGLAYAFNIFNTLQGGQTGIPFGLIEEVRNRSSRNTPASITLADPFASVAGGNPFPISVDPQALRFPAAGSYSSLLPDLRQGYFHQFNMSVQRQFGARTVAELAYVGNRGRGLIGSFNLNQPIISPTGSPANLDARRPLGSAPFVDFSSDRNDVRSWYDSFQARVERRLPSGFSVLGSYTLSKSVDYASWHDSEGEWADPRDPSLNKGPSDYDRRHLVAVSLLWDIPTVSDGRGIVGALLGGWQINAITTYYSGLPIDVTSGVDNNFDGVATNDRPNVVGDWDKPTPSASDIRTGATWFNTAAFAANGPGEVGSLSRNALTGPSYKNVDLGITRVIKLPGNQGINLRVEAFNVFNWINFSDPNAQLSSGNFGRITGARSARVLQLGIKYLF